MKTLEKNYLWTGRLSKRAKTDYIILHHAASSKCSADDIHRIHISNGWCGIGYHFYVRKDGSVCVGRPIDTIGAHTEDYNSISIGICFEGNFEKEKMNDVQKSVGNELVFYLKRMYPNAIVKKHSSFNSTVCPGKNFPFDAISQGIESFTNTSDIIKELSRRGIVTDEKLWLKKCTPNSNSYHLAKKICNMTKMSEKRNPELKSVNDIVWELSHRGIITDKALWLNLFKEDKNLYWLGYKAANMTRER